MDRVSSVVGRAASNRSPGRSGAPRYPVGHGAAASGDRTGRDQRLGPGRRGQPRGARHRHRHAVAWTGSRSASRRRAGRSSSWSAPIATGTTSATTRRSWSGPVRRSRSTSWTTTAWWTPSRCSRRSRSSRPCPRWTSRRGASSASATSRWTCSTRPGHTEGSVCLLADGAAAAVHGRHAVRGRLGPGRPARWLRRTRWSTSLGRLATLDTDLGVLPGHGGRSTIGREQPWLEMVARERGCFPF